MTTASVARDVKSDHKFREGIKKKADHIHDKAHDKKEHVKSKFHRAEQVHIKQRKLEKKAITDDIIGMSYITINRAANLKYIHNEFVREHDFRGVAGCCQTAMRVTTCDMCACGQADACCGKADPYVCVDLVYKPRRDSDEIVSRIFQSPTVDNSHSPSWRATRSVPLFISKSDIRGNGDYPKVRFTLKDDDFSADDTFSDVFGHAEVPIWKLLAAGKEVYNDKLRLKSDAALKKHKSPGDLYVAYNFHPFDLKNNHDWGVDACQYRPTLGNNLFTYQDAHQTPKKSKCFEGLNDVNTCWEDLSHTILHAKKFVFVAGWSVNFATRLTRHQDQTVGDILVEKADQGVKVFVLLWADMSSDLFAAGGMMGTSDTKTIEFFSNTKVKACRVSRENICYSAGGLGALTSKGIYTHHQKLVVADNPSSGGNLIAFIGGLDITDGRFDTCDHDLFKTLETTHHDDFYNGCLPNATKESGPREPWHDIHCKVVGAAAYDVVRNFVDRSLCQADFAEDLKVVLKKINIRSLVSDKHPGRFICQVLRSIDSSVCNYETSTFRDQFASKDYIVENSIQISYIQAIMKAQKFIYIENQYFLGSSASWLEQKQTVCNHHVIRALVSKIKHKIVNNEPFAVYILIPLFPEGDPTSMPSQEIIHFQYQTMRFMYSQIAKFLEKYPNPQGRVVTDYLQIFFAGKRTPDVDTIKHIQATSDNATIRALTSKRHMIYVHAKMLIVDDEFVIIGSANINERSMSGSRDSEIALGCWNHDDIMTPTKWPKGEVYDLRTNLWREHLGCYMTVFDDPSDLDCIRTVKNMAFKNWEAYISSFPKALPHGHYCTYPLEVDNATGEVAPLPGIDKFPDTEASIIGAMALDNNLLELLTT